MKLPADVHLGRRCRRRQRAHVVRVAAHLGPLLQNFIYFVNKLECLSFRLDSGGLPETINLTYLTQLTKKRSLVTLLSVACIINI